ncbi:MAG: winged helix-turn-helix transcriptional regulator [Candidatus Bathyarchaeota archaeon]|nr:winged helix-turn-helix transcriptional regulator [Candidatus Bathyarchaeota archaeon]
MKLNKNLLALCLVFIMAISMASVLQRQKEIGAWAQNTQSAINQKLTAKVLYMLRVCPSPYLEVSALWAASAMPQSAIAEKTPLPVNNTRTDIFNFVGSNPGVQFRAICSSLGLSIGVVQFHLAQLQRNGLITSFRKGRYKRFFPANRFSRNQMELISTLRLSTVRNILKALLEGKRLSHHELAVRVSISSQGLTWQMNRLRETGLIQEVRNGLNVNYAIQQANLPIVTETLSLIENN